VELPALGGREFAVTFGGLQPNEEVILARDCKLDVVCNDYECANRTRKPKSETMQVEDGGMLLAPAKFRNGHHGRAIMTVTGKDCAVTIEFYTGPDALALQ
jgi:hypothetical protein